MAKMVHQTISDYFLYMQVYAHTYVYIRVQLSAERAGWHKTSSLGHHARDFFRLHIRHGQLELIKVINIQSCTTSGNCSNFVHSFYKKNKTDWNDLNGTKTCSHQSEIYHLESRWRLPLPCMSLFIMAPYKSLPFGSGDRHLLSPPDATQNIPPFGWCASALAGPPRDPNRWNIFWHSFERLDIAMLGQVGGKKQTKHSIVSWVLSVLYISYAFLFSGPFCRDQKTSFPGQLGSRHRPNTLHEVLRKGLICIHRKLKACCALSTRFSTEILPRWKAWICSLNVVRGNNKTKTNYLQMQQLDVAPAFLKFTWEPIQMLSPKCTILNNCHVSWKIIAPVL